LKCPDYKIEFDHSRVDNFSLLTYLVKTEADIPKEGMQLACPNCGRTNLKILGALSTVAFAYTVLSRFLGK